LAKYDLVGLATKLPDGRAAQRPATAVPGPAAGRPGVTIRSQKNKGTIRQAPAAEIGHGPGESKYQLSIVIKYVITIKHIPSSARSSATATFACGLAAARTFCASDTKKLYIFNIGVINTPAPPSKASSMHGASQRSDQQIFPDSQMPA
jgi:hypothetical protein